ncbi:MAG: hypothetical protein JW863_02585 [Chitinispirillaceae bacterium]|nr:hypothetical protein [Chitinispirillaceae bacterium]
MKIVMIAAILLVWNLASESYGKSSVVSASGWFGKGLAAARKAEPDTALVCLKNAFSQGLSDDSLYYLWAEVYLYKGVLDTALALNYSVFADTTSALRSQVVKQRHMIYTSLGWKKEADALLDSLKGNLPWYKKIIPECNLYLSGGGYLENNAVDKEYPNPRSSDSTATLSNGNGVASLRIGWRLPFGKMHGMQFGGKVRMAGSRFAIAASTSHLSDSAETSFGGYLNYTLLSDQLSLNYTFSRKRDFLDVRSFYHQVALRYAIIGAKWFGTVEAGYNYENPVREHYYYLMTWWNRMVGKRHDISWMLFLSGMTADPLMIKEQYSYVHFRNGILYSDSTFSRPLLTSLELIFPSNYGTLENDRIIPQSFWGVNPTLRYEYQFSKRNSGGVGGNYQFTWYRENYTWVDFRYSMSDLPTTGIFNPNQTESYLAFNTDDGKYYWVESITTVQNVSLDSQPVIFRSMRRIDQAITLNLFYSHSFGQIGDLMFDLSIRRNFSNLIHSAPVDIERWYGAATLTWFLRYRPEIYR